MTTELNHLERKELDEITEAFANASHKNDYGNYLDILNKYIDIRALHTALASNLLTTQQCEDVYYRAIGLMTQEENVDFCNGDEEAQRAAEASEEFLQTFFRKLGE